MKERDRLALHKDELTRAVLELGQNVAVDEATTRPAGPQDRAELALGRTRLQLLRNDLEDIRKRFARQDEEWEALRIQVEAARLEVRIVRLPAP